MPSLILSLSQFVYSWTFKNFNKYNLSYQIINTVKRIQVEFFWWFQEIRGHNTDKCAEWLFWLLIPEDKLTFPICFETRWGDNTAAQRVFAVLTAVITMFIQEGISAKSWYLKTSLMGD